MTRDNEAARKILVDKLSITESQGKPAAAAATSAN